jgi:hypothetical protein
VNGDQGLFSRLAAAQARREQEVAGFLAALVEGREPTAEQQRAYTVAGHAERMLRRRWAREGRLGPAAQAEQLLADAYEEGQNP